MFRMGVIGLALAMVASLVIVAADDAEARIGRGKSFGTRGDRTHTAPPPTNTAPTAAPVERSMAPRNAAPNAAQNSAAAAQPSRFGGMRGLLMGGLFVAALGGIFGFGALASALGFMLQFALIAGIIYLGYRFFMSRRQPAMARVPGGTGGQQHAQPNIFRREASATGGGFGSAERAPAPVTIGQSDLETFERLLGEIQTAYSREDSDALGARVTPEMLSYFLQELDDLAKQGQRNEISGVKLLQGDLSEAWREGNTVYATVAMRYALIDATLDRATGRVIEGDLNTPTEATELWTFRQDGGTSGQGWELSAIQQTA